MTRSILIIGTALALATSAAPALADQPAPPPPVEPAEPAPAEPVEPAPPALTPPALTLPTLTLPATPPPAAPAPPPLAEPAPSAPPGACVLGQPGCFLAPDGTARDADLAYRALHRRGTPQYLRAGLEMMAFLGGATTWYWLDRERQVADWDFPSVKQRLTLDVIRFDNNDFWINFIGHPLDGTAAQALARANDLTLAESFGYSIATSLAWEYLLEYREKVSLNDILVTPVTGVVLGEFAHRLAQVVNAPRPPGTERWWHHLLGWTLGPTVALHDWIDAPRGANGLPIREATRADIWHAIDVSYGWADIDIGEPQSQSLHTLRFDGRLAIIPGYLRPGRFHRAFTDADLLSLRFDFSVGEHGASADIYADTMLIGLYGQRISASGTGTAGAVGINLACTYIDETLRPWKDQLGIAHLPGLGAEAHFLGRHASLRAYASLHGDFAGVRATPYPEWKATNPDATEKSILHKQGYYYGWGWSGRFGAVLDLPFASLGGEIFHGRYDSHEGLDRVQEELTHDVELDSEVTNYELRLRVSPWARVHAELAALSRLRHTRVDTYEEEGRQQRYTLRLGLSF